MNTKRYQPTKVEIANLKRKDNCFKVSGDRVFATFQGEGLLESEGGTVGCPAVFFRLHFCNLHCGFPNGWQCDTGYTWNTQREEFWKEPKDWTINQVKDEIEKSWNEKFGSKDSSTKRLVITGGEPLLQQELIIKLLEQIPDWKVEIETNGTIKPDIKLDICQINCSPKLENSGNKKQFRYHPEVLKAINDCSVSWFKFVVNRVDDFEEIKKIAIDCVLRPEKILIMPEGYTIETVNNHREKIEKDVASLGWRISNRNQLLWFGSKRRT